MAAAGRRARYIGLCGYATLIWLHTRSVGISSGRRGDASVINRPDAFDERIEVKRWQVLGDGVARHGRNFARVPQGKGKTGRDEWHQKQRRILPACRKKRNMHEAAS